MGNCLPMWFSQSWRRIEKTMIEWLFALSRCANENPKVFSSSAPGRAQFITTFAAAKIAQAVPLRAQIVVSG
jgi:hypothetical protein